MTSTEPEPRPAGRLDELAGIALSTTVSLLAVIYIVVPFIPVLIAWQVVAVTHLVLLFTTFSNRTTRSVPESARPLPRRMLESLSWVLPIVASGTGVASGVSLLTTEGTTGTGDSDDLLVGLLGSTSVIVAWLLLQTGFAEIYESVYERLPDPSMISFPGVERDPSRRDPTPADPTPADPTLSDFLYMAFTVGTSFAVAGATIASRKVRRVVMIQSVTSFFYNAFLIAVAIQVIQGIIANS
ncbi:Uncharacterized membrane protein [Rathayibacter oskolensis]|uniref:Uncharacterized membrane protein n=1 Tax=Rathayibacter oskolensis TaxID=1891671 RepID=A0A1X7PHL9_9MICO|nr:DUF1345 domain-containing protein [Rathayibacter oskolensis]SMH51055.1 Uncharacterized membrane protein [Rathayibacter oskolensis]